MERILECGASERRFNIDTVGLDSTTNSLFFSLKSFREKIENTIFGIVMETELLNMVPENKS